MGFDEDRQAEAIAAEWGIDVELLDESHWTLETIDGNEGDRRGYFVRFNEDTDRQVLQQLGVKPGEFYRGLGINAFDEPAYNGDRREIADSGANDGSESVRSGAAFSGSAFAGDAFAINDTTANEEAINGSDDGIYSIDEPLPDISDLMDGEDWNQPGEDEDWNQKPVREDYTRTTLNRTDNPPHGGALLTDENGRYLTDVAGNRLAVNLQGADSAISNLGFAGGSGSTFGRGTFGDFTFGSSVNQAASRDTGSNGGGEGSIEALRQEVLYKVHRLELLFLAQIDAPNRGHNHPPELLEIERPATQAQIQEVLIAIAEIRSEGRSISPSPENIVAQASIFQRIASLFRSGPGLMSSWVASGVIGNAAYDALKAHHHEIYAALVGAAHAAVLWAQHLATHL